MHFVKAVVFSASALFTLVASQSTVIAFTSTPAFVTAGQAAVIKWSTTDTTDPVTITLRKGSPTDLQTISVLTSSATGGSYTWIPASSLANGTDYALEITQGDQINYSGEFSLTGANAAAVSSASSATASLSSYEASITSSYSQSVAIASIQSVIASANSSLTNLTATTNTSSPATILPGPGSASLGTGIPMSRNTTMSMATLTGTSQASTITSTATASSSGGGSSASGAGAGSSRTSTAASSTSTGAAATQGLSGSSPLALVLCALAFIAY